jgi:hypothetical protein
MVGNEQCERVDRARDRRPLYPGAARLFRIAVLGGLASVLSLSAARAQVPLGAHVQAGPAGLPGAGLQVGYVSAKTFYTREINLVADLSSFRADGDVQVAATIGGSVRLLGIGRTIGNARYRGWDVDLGMRIGPGLLFEFRESRAGKNRRFSLFLDPFVRTVARVRRVALFAELGVKRPVLRAGFWIAVGR